MMFMRCMGVVVVVLRMGIRTEHFYSVAVDVVPDTDDFVVRADDVGVEPKVGVVVAHDVGIPTVCTVLIPVDVDVVSTKVVSVTVHHVSIASSWQGLCQGDLWGLCQAWNWLGLGLDNRGMDWLWLGLWLWLIYRFRLVFLPKTFLPAQMLEHPTALSKGDNKKQIQQQSHFSIYYGKHLMEFFFIHFGKSSIIIILYLTERNSIL